MGLDMYAWSVPAEALSEGDVVRSVDVSLPRDEVEQICYWRKHHDLHGWMEQLYRIKGGAAESFNCVTVRLTYADLTRLEMVIKERLLPETTGFFFGNNPPDPESDKRDLEFVEKAKEEIKAGKVVFYDSWW